MKEICGGSKTEPICGPAKASFSIRFNCDGDSNEIDESD
jgi:hypothetical protein